jgi:hypothetical protein
MRRHCILKLSFPSLALKIAFTVFLLTASLSLPLTAKVSDRPYQVNETPREPQQNDTKSFLPLISYSSNFIGPLTAASWSQFRYDIFGVDPNNHVIQFWYDSRWHSTDLGAVPSDIGGGGFADPSSIAAASWGHRRVDVFGVGRNGHIIQLWHDGTWHWAELAAIPININSHIGTITVASDGQSRYRIFAVEEGPDYHNIWQYQYDSGWLDWTNLGPLPSHIDGGTLPVRITAASGGLGRYDIFGIASDGNLVDHGFRFWYDGEQGHWAELKEMPSDIGGGKLVGRMAAIPSDTGYDIFSIGANGHVVQFLYSEVWQQWVDLGAVPSDIGGGGFADPNSITAASWGKRRVDVFGVGRNGHIIQYWHDGRWHWAELKLASPENRVDSPALQSHKMPNRPFVS